MPRQGFIRLASVPLFRTALPALAAVLLTAAAAHASSTRVLSMGGDGDFIEDADNVLRWYGSLASYPDLVVLELGDYVAGDDGGDARGQGGGAHVALDRAGRWGVAAAYLHADDQDGSDRPEARLAWGGAWDGLQAGAAWTYRGEVDEMALDRWSPFSREREDFTLGAGLRADAGPRTYVDLAGDLTWTDRAYAVDGGVLADDHGRADTYGLRLRAFHGVSEKVVLVPVLALEREIHPEYDLFADLYDDVYDYDMRGATLGLGLDILPDPDLQIVVSAAWRDSRLRLTGPRLDGTALRARSEDMTAQILRIGFEARTRPWLSLRAGVRQIFYDQKVHDRLAEDGEQDVSVRIHRADSIFELTLGLALHAGAIDLDMVFNDDAPFAAGSFLTGGGREEEVNFTRISLTYGF